MPPRTPPPLLTAFAALLAALLGAPGCGPEPVAPRRPNVVLVVLDTLRTDHLSAYGYSWRTSPRLDALAARGVLFEDCTAQASWTMPSMISLMTGRPVFVPIFRIPDEVPMLAETYQEAGYRTGAFIANALVSAEAGFDRGVGTFEARQKLTRVWSAKRVSDGALEFLGDDDERPVFLWLHYLDTHNPYRPPRLRWERERDELFDADEQRLVEEVLAEQSDEERERLASQVPDLAREVDLYDSAVTWIDVQIGRVLDALEEQGLSEETYVVVVADHGETLFRRRETPSRLATLTRYYGKRDERPGLVEILKKEHDGTLYEELVRTPFILAGPDLPRGRRIDALVSNLDVAPTLLGLCNLPAPAGLAGRDLSDLLRNDRPVPPAPFAPITCSEAHGLRLPDRTKLVLPHRGEPHVYDLSEDPGERHPRAPAPDELELVDRLRAMVDSGPFREWGGVDADPETLTILREMGYVR